MPADKLTLLSPTIRSRFGSLARETQTPRGGYEHFVDLRKTDASLPVQLFCNGYRNGVNKLEFLGVATLGLGRVNEIARKICGNLDSVKIFRIDWAVDVLGVSVWDLAAAIRIPNVQNSRIYRSRGGVSIYPHCSRERALVVYERLRQLRSKRDPLARIYRQNDSLTRVEVQLRGRGVPIRKFADIDRYAEIDPLQNVTFSQVRQPTSNLEPAQFLAAVGLKSLVHDVGLQLASKRFSSADWASLRKQYLEPISDHEFPNVRALLKKSVRDWLADRLRFPRA